MKESLACTPQRFHLILFSWHPCLTMILSDHILLKQGDECGSLADFGGPALEVQYSFSNFSFKVILLYQPSSSSWYWLLIQYTIQL